MRVQKNFCCVSEWSLSAIFWAIRGGVASGAVVDD